MRSRCRNSIGSSTVMTLRVVTRLSASIIAARVVDLPEPVRPVTRIRPRGANASSRTSGGIMRSSMVGTSTGTWRRASAGEPRCMKMLARKRASPATPKAKSISLWVEKKSRCSSLSSWLHHRPQIVGPGRRLVERVEHTVHAHHRRRADLDVEIARAGGDHLLQDAANVHRARGPRGSEPVTAGRASVRTPRAARSRPGSGRCVPSLRTRSRSSASSPR